MGSFLNTDVVIIGAGPAGCASAAALSQLGHSVLLIDAGQDRSKQLAGELLHPPGVEDLRTLGFGPALEACHGQPVQGFAVVDTRRERRTTQLTYNGSSQGLSLEHARFAQSLLEAVERLPNVTVWRKTRLTALLRNDADGVVLTVVRGGEQQQVFTPLLVAADGRSSFVRKLLGIEEQHDRLSSMVGVTVDAQALPHAGHGHIFIGGNAPVLAYAIEPDVARVMVDVPLGATAQQLHSSPELLNGVPQPLRGAILEALERETPRMASNDTRLPRRVTLGRVVLVGDAAGCCHPVSASGMASGISDAMALQQSLRESLNNVPRALRRYVQRRRSAQRTRIALASALYQAFSIQREDMDALRTGLLRYWEESTTGGRNSMELLSTRETRMWVMAREYMRVVGYGIGALTSEAFSHQRRDFETLMRAGTGLLTSAFPHLQDSARGGLEDAFATLAASKARRR
ncbi:Monooxygenase family protein [Stigmatella aurantiaca DW4/3-1]|uniref:Monooxygenase family protein n=1 Tax=Stigmatella aurantiaca (strain DW4/3-1) TaxID=378806 RepID=E3FPJ5_STIAD|nr:Monooxygenase family protein [Stigmatella aurantiaca DW4/3-1]